MNELTFNYKDEAFTDSLIIAEGAGIEHSSVIKLVTKYLDDMTELEGSDLKCDPLRQMVACRKSKCVV